MATQTLYHDAASDPAGHAIKAAPVTYSGYLYVEQPDYAAGQASAPSDAVAPTVTAVTPIGKISATAELVIDVDDDVAFGYTGVFVSFNGGAKQAVFRRGAFEPAFSVSSSVESLNGGKKQRLHIRPNGKWPKGTVAITVDPIDDAGNLGA